MTEWDVVQRLVTQLVDAEKERAKLSLRVEYAQRDIAQKTTAHVNAQNRINELEERFRTACEAADYQRAEKNVLWTGVEGVVGQNRALTAEELVGQLREAFAVGRQGTMPQGRSLTDVERDLLREHHEYLARVVGAGSEGMNITEMIDALENRIKGLDHLAAAFRAERDRSREQREAVEKYLAGSVDAYEAIRDMLADALGVTRGLFGVAQMLDQLKQSIPAGVTLPDLAYAWKVRQEQEKEDA